MCVRGCAHVLALQLALRGDVARSLVAARVAVADAWGQPVEEDVASGMVVCGERVVFEARFVVEDHGWPAGGVIGGPISELCGLWVTVADEVDPGVLSGVGKGLVVGGVGFDEGAGAGSSEIVEGEGQIDRVGAAKATASAVAIAGIRNAEAPVMASPIWESV